MSEERERIAFGYWSDPLCIWAFVAHDKLERILDEMGRCLDVDYHVVPVFGSVPARFSQGSWASGGGEQVARNMRRIAQAHGWDDVTGEVWCTDPPASSWASGAALKAVAALERAGEVAPGTGARYLRRLSERFFVENRNIARRAVQLEAAEELLIPRELLATRLDDGSAVAAVWEDFERKESLRIQGSPTYVFDGGRAMLYGNFAYGILRATAEELVRGVNPGGSPC